MPMFRLPFVAFISCLFFCADAQRLVLPGDHPDPSVVKIGDTYWASATSSNWMPAFPLLQSNDLINWKTVGRVFKVLPSWADYYFWAPEISYDGGKVYVYYAAHKKGGNLCVGVASADRPEGPYKDHGPLVCQTDGSIDAFPVRDENGRLCLIWKEDGNSAGRPTPIWMQEINESRTSLVGEKKELFRNDAPWEGALVEGVSLTKHGNYYYAFYAAAGCCGNACTYQTGIARARTLQGPWEKYAGNPVLKAGGDWKCPGHGTVVEKDGRFYFLYHAYNTAGTVYTGREGLLQEFRFSPDGWVEFLNDAEPAAATPPEHKDRFDGKALSREWEWSVFQHATKELRRGKLVLQALPDACGAFVGQKTTAADYTAEVEVDRSGSGAAPGLALVGDEKNAIVALLKGATLQLLQVKDGKTTVLFSSETGSGKKGFLQMQVAEGKSVRFFYGATKETVRAINDKAVDAGYLPPWDRGLRIALVAVGKRKGQAVFDNFKIRDGK